MNYDKEWYDSLTKPSFQPPEWVFAPVWIFLYIVMTVAFLLVLFTPLSWIKFFAVVSFIAQVYVNLQWYPTFFLKHDLRGAFLIAIFLTLLVFITTVLFFKISIIAGIMFIPYFLWCLFAAVLSFEILERNEW